MLDEPTAVLTPQETEDLFGVLKELVADGLSIILITHKLGELLGVSDEITIIRDGRVVDTVQTAETNEGDLARLMVGRDVLLRVEKEASRSESRAWWRASSSSNTGARAVDVASRWRAGEILGIAGVDGNGHGARRGASPACVTPRAGASTSTATSRLWGPTPGRSGVSPTCPRTGARGSCRTSPCTRTTP